MEDQIATAIEEREMASKEDVDALVKAARQYLGTNPAFRLRPVGGEGSIARLRQQDAIAVEDALLAALAPFQPQEKEV